MVKPIRKGSIEIEPQLNDYGKIATYSIRFPGLDENNTNLTVVELDFIEEIRKELKEFEHNNQELEDENNACGMHSNGCKKE